MGASWKKRGEKSISGREIECAKALWSEEHGTQRQPSRAELDREGQNSTRRKTLPFNISRRSCISFIISGHVKY